MRRLQILHELRARGTLVAVGQALSLSPSGVSQQLTLLQREVGVPLVEKIGRNVRLTPAGELLAEHAEALLNRLEEAENDLAARGGRVTGTFRIGAFASAITRLVAPCLPALTVRHPSLRVEVEHHETDRALHRLALGEIDLVLANEYEHLPRRRDHRLAHEPLLVEAVRVALPRRHTLTRRPGPIPLAELARAVWASGTQNTSHASMVTNLCNQLGGFHPDIRHRSDDPGVLLALVGKGRATTLVSQLVDAELDPAIEVRDLADHQPTRRLLAWFRASAAVRPATAAVLGALRTVVANTLSPNPSAGLKRTVK
ncbi:LysR substrate-binding domain-containing protein [Saccharothrix australiensis]|nr:LysR substrate-binding domain-containing protein [Saccharothrix australiensis]